MSGVSREESCCWTEGLLSTGIGRGRNPRPLESTIIRPGGRHGARRRLTTHTVAPNSDVVTAPRGRLHFAPENLVHIRLVFLTSPSEPVEDVGIHAKTHQLLDRPIKTAHLNVGRQRPAFRRIGKVDLRIRSIGQALQLPSLLVTDGSGKERARGDSPFLPR